MARGLTPGGRSASPFASALGTYGTNLGVAALGLLNVVVVSRALGPVGRGEIALLVAIPVLCSYVAAMGVQESNANVGAAEPDQRPHLATNSLLLGAALGAGAALLTAVAIALVPAIGGEAPRRLEWLALCCVPLLLTKLYLNLLLQSDGRFTITNVAWVSGPAITASGSAVLAVTGQLSVTACIGLWIAGQAVGLGLLVIHTARHVGFGSPNRALARQAVGFGLRTHVGQLMGAGTWRLDQWIVGAVAGSRQLGLYSVAVAWAELLFYIPAAIVAVQRRELVCADRATAARRAAQIMRRATVLATVAGIGLLVAAPLLCTEVFGPEFSEATGPLRVLALGATGIVVVELLANALVAQRRPLQASSALGVAFMVTIALDLLLIPTYGGLGAAIATSTAYTAGALAVALVFCRELGARPRSLLPRPGDVAWFWRRGLALLHR